jgi:SAM-dependent methyltransferase
MFKQVRRLTAAILRRCGHPCGYGVESRARMFDARLSGWFLKESGQLCEGFCIRPEDTVIDVGCGGGGACDFAASCGAEVIATDVDAEKIRALEARLRLSRARALRTIVSDSNPLPVADGIATRVICMEVLEHVEDPPRLLAELVRVGSPDARYLISTPDPFSESVQRMVAPQCYWQPPNHLRVFQRDELDRLVREAGLVIQNRPSHFFYWFMWWLLFWGNGGQYQFGEPESRVPVLDHWNKTWHALLCNVNGRRVAKALNELMPKSNVLVARKAA